MDFVTNLFPIMGVQNLSKSVQISQSYLPKFAATFLCPTVYICTSDLSSTSIIWYRPQGADAVVALMINVARRYTVYNRHSHRLIPTVRLK